MTLVLLAASARAAEGCSASAAEIAETIDTALRALEQLEPDRFKAATDDVDRLVPCLAEPLSKHLAAEIHRAKGIRAVLERDPEAARIFAAARALEPAWRIPSTLVPEGHPVRTEYAKFDLATGTFEQLPAPAEGALFLDANPDRNRPTAWPTVAQYLAGDGSVRFTAYVVPGAPFPEYPVATTGGGTGPGPTFGDPPPPPQPPPPPKPPRAPLWAASITSALVTGGLVTLAGLAERDFQDLETPDADLPGLRARANSLVVTSGFTGAAAVGFGVAAVLVR